MRFAVTDLCTKSRVVYSCFQERESHDSQRERCFNVNGVFYLILKGIRRLWSQVNKLHTVLSLVIPGTFCNTWEQTLFISYPPVPCLRWIKSKEGAHYSPILPTDPVSFHSSSYSEVVNTAP